MKGRFLLSSNADPAEGNVYADKSVLILDWLLREGASLEEISLRHLAKEVGVSIGLVQRVFGTLVFKGLLQVEGVRTAKRFVFKKPKLLLEDWIAHYNLATKCKMRTYRSSFSGKAELLAALAKSKFRHKVALALHSAAEALGFKNTNLNTLELYILDPNIRVELEEALGLEPQEKGYEVLLLEPYYKSLLSRSLKSDENITICPALLTFLDLYHFPLRGQEQAEFMIERVPQLKRVYNDTKPRR